MNTAAHAEHEAVTIGATIRCDSRRLTVRILATDAAGFVVCAVQSTFARNQHAQREAIAWCRRKGVTQYTITN